MKKFDFNDILIQPADLSDIDSRSEIYPRYNSTDLPIFASPMDTVVSESNLKLYTELGINVCLPRGINKVIENGSGYPYIFESYGLGSVREMINGEFQGGYSDYILIDVANGHMKMVCELVRDFKKSFPNKILMVGNIANPKTYKFLSEAGADFIRVGIGNGAGCLTTQQTGVGFPMASLIKECYELKLQMDKSAKIVADGGFSKYSDIIKALGLGADYVMLGSILNKTIESSGSNYVFGIRVPQKLAESMYRKGFKVSKKFRGMSTKEVQEKWGRSSIKTSEGVVRFRPVEYTLNGWTENFVDYLKSNMSYSNARTLNDFIGKVNYNFITYHSYNRFNK